MDNQSTAFNLRNHGDCLSRYAHIMESKDETETLAQLTTEVAKLGFDQINFTLLRGMSKSYENAYVYSNHAKEWMHRYESQSYWEIDPIFNHSLQRKSPLVWNADTFETRRQRHLYEEANIYGIYAGITLPLGSMGAAGMLTCVTDSVSGKTILNDGVAALPQLTLLRDVAFDSLSRFIFPDATSEVPKLSRREKECLQWHAQGKTSWELGSILSISEACVNYHFNKIRTKFNVTQRHQAVIKAIMLGLISA